MPHGIRNTTASPDQETDLNCNSWITDTLKRLYAGLMPPLTTSLLLGDGLRAYARGDKDSFDHIKTEEAQATLIATSLYGLLYLVLTSKKAADTETDLMRILRYFFCDFIPNNIYGTWVSLAIFTAIAQVLNGSKDLDTFSLGETAESDIIDGSIALGIIYTLLDLAEQYRNSSIGKLNGSTVTILGHELMLGLTLAANATNISKLFGATIPSYAAGSAALISATTIVAAQQKSWVPPEVIKKAKYTCYGPWEANTGVALTITGATGTPTNGYPVFKYALMGAAMLGQGLWGAYDTCFGHSKRTAQPDRSSAPACHSPAHGSPDGAAIATPMYEALAAEPAPTQPTP